MRKKSKAPTGLLLSQLSTNKSTWRDLTIHPPFPLLAFPPRRHALPLKSNRWDEETFGPHFSASPLEGIVAPLTETGIEVVFSPEGIDDDIRREGVLCMIEVRCRRGYIATSGRLHPRARVSPHKSVPVRPMAKVGLPLLGWWSFMWCSAYMGGILLAHVPGSGLN